MNIYYLYYFSSNVLGSGDKIDNANNHKLRLVSVASSEMAND